MKRIMTKSEKEKKDRTNQIIIGIVLVGLMIMSTLGYSLLSGDDEGSSTKITYNGIDFYKYGNQWQTSINNKVFTFMYSPLETEEINVPASVSFEQFYNKPLYLDSDNPSVNYEIAVNLQDYTTGVATACLDENDCSDDNSPIKTCSDNVIVIRNNNQTSITTNGNCTYIYGNDNIIKAGDAFLYKILGVTS